MSFVACWTASRSDDRKRNSQSSFFLFWIRLATSSYVVFLLAFSCPSVTTTKITFLSFFFCAARASFIVLAMASSRGVIPLGSNSSCLIFFVSRMSFSFRNTSKQSPSWESNVTIRRDALPGSFFCSWMNLFSPATVSFSIEHILPDLSNNT